MTDWQPIETAPKDGTRVLAHMAGYPLSAIVAWFSVDGFSGWAECSGEDGGECPEPDWELTHWMPLPATLEAAT